MVEYCLSVTEISSWDQIIISKLVQMVATGGKLSSGAVWGIYGLMYWHIYA